MKKLKRIALILFITAINYSIYSKKCPNHEPNFTTCPENGDIENICCNNINNNRQINSSEACSTCCSNNHYNCGITTFIPRSSGANTAREISGWSQQLYKPFYCENYGAITSTFEYSSSFRPERIAQKLFCTDCLTFSGSQATDREDGKDIVADYFGLPTDFVGTLSINPKIERYIVDFNFFFGLDQILEGLFFKINIPVTHTRWDLGLDDCIACRNKFRGCEEFPECYMNSNTPDGATPSSVTPESFPLCSFTVENRSGLNRSGSSSNCQVEVLSDPFVSNKNCSTQSLREALSGNFTFGDIRERWKFGKFSFSPKKKTGVADVDVILGVNCHESDFSHLAVYGQVVLPTGNRPKGKFIFEPILGNGKHWKAGAGASGHISMYSDYNSSYNASIYFEGNITHLFETNQIRSFDFCNNGFFSRYMLLKEFDINDQYIGRTINAINFATRNAKVTVDYEIDFSAMAVIQKCDWIINVGYNIYAKDKEKVCINTECPCDIDQRRFGIKGTEGVCCIEYQISGGNIQPCTNGCDIQPCDPEMLERPCSQLLNSTQPNATMLDVVQPTAQTIDPSATTVCLAYNNPIITTAQPISGNTFFIANTNEAPTIISCKDLDPNSAAQNKMVTHKAFFHIGHAWPDSCYEPHFGLGGEIELEGKNKKNALNQWGIWAKCGITF